MPSDTRPEAARPPHAPEGGRQRRLDDRRNVGRIVYALSALCALLLLIDPLVHKHGAFAIEHWWGFYGICGFAGCVVLVLAAKALRLIVMRPEDYHERR